MKGIGLISYPLYLWHWPILSFLYIIAGGIAPIKYRLLGIVAMFSLATLTYFIIEKPLRYGGHANAKSLALIILMLILGYVGYSAFDPNSFFDLIIGKTL